MEYPIYCEQPYYDAYFEIWNTITNFAFIIAGILLFIRLNKSSHLDGKAIYLSSLLIIIGFGSLAWHFYRSNFTLMADSIPIALFVLSYLFFYLKHVTKRLWHLIVLFIGFFIYSPILTIVLDQITGFENGGASYFSAISYLLIIQVYNYYNRKSAINKTFIIIFVFILSLSFRQIDLYVCEMINFGTHFMWHILNALTLYLMIRFLYKKV